MSTAAFIPDPDGSWDNIARYAMTFNGYAHFGESWSDTALQIRERFDETGELPDNAPDLRAQLFVEFRVDRFVGDGSELVLVMKDGRPWTPPDRDNERAANPDPQSPTQVRRRAIVRRLRELADYQPARYHDDSDHPARLDKNGKTNLTRSPRSGNGLYCMVWPDHDVLKVGLSSGSGNARSGSASKALHDYLAHEGAAQQPCIEWRAQLPFMDGATWGDCQRFELVVATALKRRLGAASASALGFEWLTRTELADVVWREELEAACADAVEFSSIQGRVAWAQHTGVGGGDSGADNARRHGPAQLDAHRTMRNKRAECALKGCGAPLTNGAVISGRFTYCSDQHADDDGSVALHGEEPAEFAEEPVGIEQTDEPPRTAADVRNHLDEIIDDCFWESPIIGSFDSASGDAGLILDMDGRKFEVIVREQPDADGT